MKSAIFQFFNLTAKFCIIILANFAVLIILASPSNAERLESDSYVIQFGNFNTGSGSRGSSSYGLTDTLGQTGAGPFGVYGSGNYFIGSGFQYIYQIRDFSFSLSKTNIDLGLLSSVNHSSDSHTMTINTRGAGGYQVLAVSLGPLTSESGNDTIPNTSCDDGTCNHLTARPWTIPTNPGFGYNIAGTGANPDFINTDYFKAFANSLIGQPAQVVMSSENLAISETATITYKAGISGNQPAGNYSTSVSFIAVPGY